VAQDEQRDVLDVQATATANEGPQQSPERHVEKREGHRTDPPNPARARRDTSIGALHATSPPRRQTITDLRRLKTATHLACASVGLRVDGDSIPYVAGWGEGSALEAVTEFATTIDALARRV